MVSYDGAHDLQLSYSQDSETAPRWSPDGKYLTFLSSRPGKTKGNQVWIMDRMGGEAMQLTDLKGRLQSYEWSPDSKTAGARGRRSRSGSRSGGIRAEISHRTGAETHCDRPLQI